MKILVTGINGLIGSAIGTHLLAEGHEVIGLSRRAAGDGCTVSVCAELGGEAFVERVASMTPSCHAIVHAGASLDKNVVAPSISLTNCLGTQQVVALAMRWGGVPIVNISGTAVVGVPRILPVTEDHPTAPTTSYHASKLFGEHVLEAASNQGIPTVSLRVTAPIGPAMPANRILPVFIRRALDGQPIELAGRGTRRQDYVDVHDIASAVVACLARPHVRGALNIGAGRSISNLDLAELCVQMCDSRSEIRFPGTTDPEESHTWDVSIDRAREMIGYSPRYALEDSARTIKDALCGLSS